MYDEVVTKRKTKKKRANIYTATNFVNAYTYSTNNTIKLTKEGEEENEIFKFYLILIVVILIDLIVVQVQ